MTSWYANEAFWKDFYPFLFPPERFEVGAAQVEKILALIEFSGQDILDLCCGPGRHAVPLARQGFSVTGVDRSPFLLERARRRPEAAGVEVEWIQEDMRRFARPERYDLALNMFTSFGYFEDQEENQQVLRNLHDSLRPAGVCVIDVLGKERLARVFLETSSHVLEDGSLMVERREILDGWQRIRNQWILIREGQATAHHFEHSVYSGQELIVLLQRAGFSAIQLYGDLDGNPYDVDAARLIAVAWKRNGEGIE